MKFSLILTVASSALVLASVTPQTIAGYLDEINATYQQEGDVFFIIQTDETTGEAFAIFYIEVNDVMDACFMAGPTPGLVPSSGAGRVAALELLSNLNSSYPFVKFEADPATGEVMCTYTFSTENGVGFEAFTAMISVIFGTIEETADEFIALRR
jgi:hypothetical protein